MPVTSSPAPRIGIVVTDVYAAEDPDYDTPLLLPALAARGADPRRSSGTMRRWTRRPSICW
jgi:hypothetical protein